LQHHDREKAMEHFHVTGVQAMEMFHGFLPVVMLQRSSA
jgi:hypothetical protein